MTKLTNWGEEAHKLLKDIKGQHSHKKRLTLLALADCEYTGEAQGGVFKDPTCGSKTAHYKWLEEDTVYKAAYDFLVGNEETPGLARQKRQEEEDEAELEAVTAVSQARRKLKLLTMDAIKTLECALSFGEWGESIRAANSILDRNPETMSGTKQQHSGTIARPITIIEVEGGEDDELL